MSFQQGLSGLNAAARALDVVGNNIANSGTVGFKGANAQFADIYAASLNGTGASQVGIGANLAGVAQVFTQGNLTTTNNPLDLAINGGGFYRMSDARGAGDGTIAYTRNGQFLIDKEGYVVNGSGLYLTGLQADPVTGIVPNSGEPGAIRVDTSLIAPRSTTESTIGFNLDSRQAAPANTPFDPTDPLSYSWSTTQPVYDSLGNPHTMQVFFVKLDADPLALPPIAPNTWQMYTALDGGAPTAPTDLVFDSAGNLPNTVLNQSFALTNGAVSPLTFTLDVSEATQYGAESGLNAMIQDGYTSGRLAGISVAPDGTVQGVYSNGRTRDMGRVVLATFPNPNGLQNVGGNLWRETNASGQPVTGTPGQGNLGVLQSAAVEDSTVDLTAELVDMIVQQRAYQANAQTIKTQDSILQTLVNLR